MTSIIDWTEEIKSTGYNPCTCFYQELYRYEYDYGFNDVAIREEIERLFDDLFEGYTKHRSGILYNARVLTELSMVCNWKCWAYNANHLTWLAAMYSDMYYKIDGWCLDNFSEDDLHYYLTTTN